MNHSEIKRNQNESFDTYKIRVCKNRELYDLTWKDVAEILNKESQNNFNESTYRKWYAAWSQGFQYAVEQKTDNEILQEIEDKTIEFQKQKYQFQDQKREFANLVRKQARFEHLQEEINKSILELEKNKPLLFSEVTKSNTNIHANVLWSDWHFGSSFKNTLNSYSPEIFKKRLETLVSETIHYIKEHNVDTLTIGALGDFLSGAIHVSTRVQASEDVIKQITTVSEALAESVAEISKHVRLVKFINIIGNHARLISDKTQSLMNENLENIIPWFLQSRLKDFSNVEFYKDEDGYFIDESFDIPHVYVHGDFDHVASVAKNLPQMLGIVPRYIFSGHIHHETFKEHGKTKVVTNGSLVGVDDYAVSKRFYAEPMQRMHIFNDKEKIQYHIPIYLEE